MLPKRIAELVLVVAILAPQFAMAQDIDKVLDKIAAHAERICKTAPIKSSSSELQLNAKANAELVGLLKKLADLGIDGAVQYKKTETVGVLQKELANLLSRSVDCKERVSDHLVDKLVPSVAARAATVSPQSPPKTDATPPVPSAKNDPIKWVEYGQFLVVNGGGSEANIYSVLLQGSSTTSVSIKDAYAISGLTGRKQNLMMNVAYKGYFPVDQVDIPPQSRVWLELIFKPAPRVDDFLKEWGRFSVTINYNGITYHHDFDEDFIREKLIAMNAGELGPHVTVKPKTEAK